MDLIEDINLLELSVYNIYITITAAITARSHSGPMYKLLWMPGAAAELSLVSVQIYYTQMVSHRAWQHLPEQHSYNFKLWHSTHFTSEGSTRTGNREIIYSP